ncbi:sigma-70 family RNA polymerase sigma factor [Paludibaculum fermentans]|uniref:sigma-70 family RNA polymerase sigma factor n=1 Tax=Paludibaculum fermentans TaxID=1473598 RepID=UPI003EBFA9A0
MATGSGWRKGDVLGSDVSVLLDRAAHGDNSVQALLFELIHTELHKLARSAMSRERPDHTLQPTALVNEAYLRLVGDGTVSWQSRAHFFGAAARAMRQILINHAQERSAAKRGSGGVRVELSESIASFTPDPDVLIAIDIALEQLATVDPRAARIVELRYFVGLSFDEVAALLGISVKTAKRDWEFARVWLERRLRTGGPQ